MTNYLSKTVDGGTLIPRVPTRYDIEGCVEAVFDNNGVTIDRYSVVAISSVGVTYRISATADQSLDRGVLEVCQGGVSCHDENPIDWDELPEEVASAVWRVIRDLG